MMRVTVTVTVTVRDVGRVMHVEDEGEGVQ